MIGEPHAVFYGGVPIVSSEGFAWGTLCVIDTTPRKLEPEQLDALKLLSKQIVKLFELRRIKEKLEDKQEALELKNKELRQFAQVAAHDLKSPLNSIIMMNDLIKSHETPIENPEINEFTIRNIDRIFFY